jgi:hypothetical protein
MGLRDFVKPKETDINKEKAIEVYEKNMDLYKGKSTTMLLMITADELGIRKDNLMDILQEYYED